MKTYVIFDRDNLSTFYVVEAETDKKAWAKVRKETNAIGAWPPEPGDQWDIIEAKRLP